MLVATTIALLLAAQPALPLKPCVVQQVDARCGTLRVPENRARPNGRELGLNVVVLPSVKRPAKPDAIALIAGGPGGVASEMAGWASMRFVGLRQTRDVLLVDQRGTGGSNALACLPPAKPPETDLQKLAYARACLREAGGDVAQYGTRAAMDDLDAVRAALGYRQLDLYGGSYGATAAQVYLKRHPARVRTVVLLGATEMDVPFYGRFAVNAQRALADVARRCAGDAVCRKAFPRWRAQLTALIRKWNAKPVRNRAGETTNGTGLAGVVQSMLLDASTAAQIPLVVSSAARGDYGPFNRQIQPGETAVNLMFYSIWCNEPWVGLDAKGPWHTDFDGLTRSAIAQYRSACAYVPKRAEPASAWRLPHSRVPLLAIAGGADPQDPISNLPRLKQAFPNSRTIVVPHFGHSFDLAGCLPEIVGRFVLRGNAKGIDTSCVRSLGVPAFPLE